MSSVSESGGRAQQMRAKAQELEDAAERATDPEERECLQDKANHLTEESKRTGGKGPDDMGMNPL